MRRSTESAARFRIVRDYLAKELEKEGLAPDKYDPDFILGTLMSKMAKESWVLTGTGIKRLKL